ncbi:MAG: hypothetical protein MUF58_09055 [Arcicella sp.]|jgi:archaellum component FlaC|nr:hypothetical protein [Arcicella sp.]
MKKVLAWVMLAGFLTANLDACTGCSKSGGGKPRKSGGAGCTSCTKSKRSEITDVGEEYKRIKNELDYLKVQFEKKIMNNSELLKDVEVIEQDVKALKNELTGKVINNGISIIDQESGQTSLLTIAIVEELATEVTIFKESLKQENSGNHIAKESDNRYFFVGRYEIISDCQIAKGSITTIKSDYDPQLKQKLELESFCGKRMDGIAAFQRKEILLEDTPIYINYDNRIRKGKISFGQTITFELEIVDSNGSFSYNCTGTFKKIE